MALPLSAAGEQEDDVRRFEGIYRDSFAAVHAYALRRLPDRADDVVAETFLVAWRRLGDVPPDALPWLYATARRVIADLRRSSRRQEAAGLPQAGPGSGEADSRLLHALARLSESDRELLLLVYWEDLEPRRAARAFGCSRATLSTRLWRAHERLRSRLEEEEGAV